VTIRSRALAVAAVSGAVVIMTACGRKGPPLPPLVRLPTPPADIVAERRGNTVGIRFMIPGTNTDGSRPANIERVEVFALSGPPNLTVDEIVREGDRVARIDVKAPRDPDEAVDPEDPDGDVAEPEGKGLDQGAATEVTETLTGKPAIQASRPAVRRTGVPELCAEAAAARSYVAVGFSTSGRRGPVSKRVNVPLMAAPPAPPAPSVRYGEAAITVSWPEPPGAEAADAAAAAEEANDGLLPAKAFGVCPTRWAFHVYERAPVVPDTSTSNSAAQETPAADASGTPTAVVRLTTAPVAELRFEDKRIAWGVERCYAIGIVQRLNDLAIESERSDETCITLQDTFPPPVPTGLRTVASQGAINLIWNPTPASDLAGYLVLRGLAAGGALEAVTPTPVTETSFRDTVPSGGTYRYAVQSVDTEGNASAESATAEDTAR
jgi:hypothetical protein